MSEMERNKGILRYMSVDTENFTEDDFDTYRDNGFMVLSNEIYQVEWEVKSDTDCYEFSEVEANPDGTIYFHTMHYNGGGSLEEVLEKKL